MQAQAEENFSQPALRMAQTQLEPDRRENPFPTLSGYASLRSGSLIPSISAVRALAWAQPFAPCSRQNASQG